MSAGDGDRGSRFRCWFWVRIKNRLDSREFGQRRCVRCGTWRTEKRQNFGVRSKVGRSLSILRPRTDSDAALNEVFNHLHRISFRSPMQSCKSADESEPRKRSARITLRRGVRVMPFILWGSLGSTPSFSTYCLSLSRSPVYAASLTSIGESVRGICRVHLGWSLYCSDFTATSDPVLTFFIKVQGARTSSQRFEPLRLPPDWCKPRRNNRLIC